MDKLMQTLFSYIEENLEDTEELRKQCIAREELENRLLAYPEVREALVCGQSGRITAEIYPDEAYAGDPEHFQTIIRQVNKGQPLYKQIASVRLRGTEFEKNTSMKIIRHKK